MTHICRTTIHDNTLMREFDVEIEWRRSVQGDGQTRIEEGDVRVIAARALVRRPWVDGRLGSWIMSSMDETAFQPRWFAHHYAAEIAMAVCDAADREKSAA